MNEEENNAGGYGGVRSCWIGERDLIELDLSNHGCGFLARRIRSVDLRRLKQATLVSTLLVPCSSLLVR
jgi:hypothetical protein